MEFHAADPSPRARVVQSGFLKHAFRNGYWNPGSGPDHDDADSTAPSGKEIRMNPADSSLRLRLLALVAPEDSASPRPAEPPWGWRMLKTTLWTAVAILVAIGTGQLR
jgi:hypothetical protein